MGKRRTNAPHRDRNAGNDTESDEEEEDFTEPDPLKPEQIASIKTRKKLVAKRRGAPSGETSGAGIFGALSKANTTTESDESDKPATSVFSGFKGFSAFAPKTSVEAPKPAQTTTSSMFAPTSVSSSFLAKDTSKTSSSFSFTPKGSDLTNTTSQKDLFSKATNGNTQAVTQETKVSETLATPKINDSSNNLSETEMNFINELNVVYEKYYGKTKRVLKLPAQFENQATDSEKPDEGRRNKYGLLLAELNKHCAKWISKHVEEDPLIVMTPIFVDYFNYLILMEKNFFPLANTFKSKTPVPPFASMNGTAPLFKSATNGSSSSTVAPVLLSSVSSNIVFNKNEINGHSKEESQKINGFDVANHADKENEEAEKDKRLSESSKSFASFASKAPINPISFSATSLGETYTTPFKSMEGTKLAEKEASSSGEFSTMTTSQTNMFKFSAAATTEKKLSTIEEPKLSFKSPATAQLQTLTPTFKFGAAPTADSSTTAKPVAVESTSSLFGSKAAESSSPSLFGKSAESASSTLFGKPAQASSLFAKSSETTTTPSSLFAKASETTTPSALFGKPSVTPAFAMPEKKTERKPDTPAPSFFSKSSVPTGGLFSSTMNTVKESDQAPSLPSTTTTTPTFSSLMNASQATTGTGGFKGFAGFGANSTTPTFGAATTTTTATADITAPTEPAKPFFSFGAAATGGAQPGGLFGAGTTGSSLFGSGGTFPGAASGAADEEEEYVPPKPESSDVKEEGAVYEKRTKLFYYNEKEKKFVDRGIGNLYLKPINDGKATQLIVRADNKLANILLNVKLNKAYPITKIGAKDVSYLCIPNPAIPNVDPKLPCKFLFKVKTEDDANELNEKLNEYKK